MKQTASGDKEMQHVKIGRCHACGTGSGDSEADADWLGNKNWHRHAAADHANLRGSSLAVSARCIEHST